MKKIIKPRQTGKTTDLIEISEKTGIYILTANRICAGYVFNMAQEQKRNIPFPVALCDYQRTGFRGSFINHILMQRLQPKAWMPLPKSYEPQESEGECKNCEYYRNPDYTRCHECKAESEDKE